MLYYGAELVEVLDRRVLNIHRDMAICHAEPANARGLVGHRLLVGVEPEIDDVTDAQGTNVSELRLGWLAGCRDPIVQTGQL